MQYFAVLCSKFAVFRSILQYLRNLQQQKVRRGNGSSRRTSPCAAEISMTMNIEEHFTLNDDIIIIQDLQISE